MWPEDAFAALFLTHPGPTARGDCWYRITTPGAASGSCFANDVLPVHASAASVASMVLRGLGDRAVLCHVAPLPVREGGAGRDPAQGALQAWGGGCELLVSVQVCRWRRSGCCVLGTTCAGTTCATCATCATSQLNPATALRVLDVGPEADDKAAVKEFRAFWGDKAELRRFKVRC